MIFILKLCVSLLWAMPLHWFLDSYLTLTTYQSCCIGFSLGSIGFLITNYLIENTRD